MEENNTEGEDEDFLSKAQGLLAEPRGMLIFISGYAPGMGDDWGWLRDSLGPELSTLRLSLGDGDACLKPAGRWAASTVAFLSSRLAPGDPIHIVSHSVGGLYALALIDAALQQKQGWYSRLLRLLRLSKRPLLEGRRIASCTFIDTCWPVNMTRREWELTRDVETEKARDASKPPAIRAASRREAAIRSQWIRDWMAHRTPHAGKRWWQPWQRWLAGLWFRPLLCPKGILAQVRVTVSLCLRHPSPSLSRTQSSARCRFTSHG